MSVKIKCPHCLEEIDLRDAEVLGQLDGNQVLYLAAIQGLVRPVGFVQGKVIFVPCDRMQELLNIVSPN